MYRYRFYKGDLRMKPISTLREFQEMLDGISIYDLLRYRDEPYKEQKCYSEILIEKKTGGYRILHAPQGKLKTVQQQVLTYLQDVEVSPAAYGYVRGKNIADHANCHLGKKTLVKLDIEDFFDTVTFSQVYHAIECELSNSPAISVVNNELIWFFTKFCTLKGALPQGAVTSPVLSNLVFLPLDRLISSYCARREICYTRYSDDLIFSGDIGIAALISFIRRLLKENGFTLNPEKIVVAAAGRQKKVTGVVVNERLQVERNYRRTIRQEMYYIQKFGLEGHLTAKNVFDDELQNAPYTTKQKKQAVKELQRLLGKINFVLQIDPQNREFLTYRSDCQVMLQRLPKWMTEG